MLQFYRLNSLLFRSVMLCCGRSLCIETTRTHLDPITTTVSPIRTRLNDMYKLKKMYADLSNDVLRRDQSYMHSMTDEVTAILTRASLDRDTLHVAARLMRLFGNLNLYNDVVKVQGFFDSVSGVLVITDSEDVLKTLLPSFLWSCSKLRYYNQSLLSHVADFIVDRLEEFSYIDLDMIVHAYAHLNHHVPQLIPKMERLLLSKDALRQVNAQRLSWTVAWAGMVFMDYPKEVLTHILRDEYITECLNKVYRYCLLSLFQLKISLNTDGQDLNLGLGYEVQKQFGQCRSGIRDISEKIFLRAYADKLRALQLYRKSVFSTNLYRALRTALGHPSLIQPDAFSLSGYTFDFEVLFDEHGKPLQIPLEWKYKSSGMLLSSVGAGKACKPRPTKMKISDDFVESMRETEQSGGRLTESGVSLPFSDIAKIPCINLASDWGSKFSFPPRDPARRVVIEADGYHHYASNCDHALGHTVLKRRHVEALGWQMLNVNYRTWKTLDNGDAQVKYISSLLFES